jgi:RNA polymerase sigma-70 factor (ECF subfamily)
MAASSDQRSDAELLAAATGGDDEAFATFYRRYLPLVLRWCVRETRNADTAADLAAETFAAILCSAHSYRPERGDAVAWVLAIARNKLVSSYRRRRVESSARRRLRLEPIELNDPDLERVEELASRDGEILRHLDTLPADQREALVRHVVRCEPYELIAAELACSPAVIRQRVSRGLRGLRSRLEME